MRRMTAHSRGGTSNLALRRLPGIRLRANGPSGVRFKNSTRTPARVPPNNSKEPAKTRHSDFDSLAHLEASIAFNAEPVVGDIDQNAVDLAPVLGNNRALLSGF